MPKIIVFSIYQYILTAVCVLILAEFIIKQNKLEEYLYVSASCQEHNCPPPFAKAGDIKTHSSV